MPILKSKVPKVVAEFYARRVWDDKDLSAIDELFHNNCVIHSSLGDFQGKEFMKNVVQVWWTGFPDLSVTNHAIIYENDLVVIQWQAKGTHQGVFNGLKPSGKSISYSGVTIYRVTKEKITEYWAYLDMHYIVHQIT